MSELNGKTILITGSSRGIGHAMAIKCASLGASIAIVAKEEPGVLQSVAQQMTEAGGHALPIHADLTSEHDINRAVALAAEHFGGLDVVVNNTSAFSFTDTLHTTPEKFDLLMATNVRATFFVSKASVPYLKQAENPHIVINSPPLHIDGKWFKDHLLFTMSKYAMSLCTLGMAEEFRSCGIAVNSLWPQTTIATKTIQDHFLPEVYAGSRWPAIMADALVALIKRPAKECSGNFFVDEALLREEGMVDFSHYAVDPSAPLVQDLFTDSDYTALSSRMTPLSQSLFLERR